MANCEIDKRFEDFKKTTQGFKKKQIEGFKKNKRFKTSQLKASKKTSFGLLLKLLDFFEAWSHGGAK